MRAASAMRAEPAPRFPDSSSAIPLTIFASSSSGSMRRASSALFAASPGFPILRCRYAALAGTSAEPPSSACAARYHFSASRLMSSALHALARRTRVEARASPSFTAFLRCSSALSSSSYRSARPMPACPSGFFGSSAIIAAKYSRAPSGYSIFIPSSYVRGPSPRGPPRYASTPGSRSRPYLPISGRAAHR